MGRDSADCMVTDARSTIQDALRQRLKLLTNEKTELQSHLMDCRVGIEDEGKAFHKTNDERRAYLSEIAKLSSTLEANRRVQYFTQPRGAPESQQKRSIREKEASRRADTESKAGGGGGGAAAAAVGGGWRGPGRKAVTGSRLATLKQQLKHGI